MSEKKSFADLAIDPNVSDAKFGRILLLKYFEDAIGGNPPLTPEKAEKLRLKILEGKISSDQPENQAVQNALQYAAQGDFERAGKLIRAHLRREAEALNDQQYSLIGRRRSAQVSAWGSKGAEDNRTIGARNRARVLEEYKKIKLASQGQANRSRNAIAKQIGTNLDLNEHTVRNHLTQLKKEKKLD